MGRFSDILLVTDFDATLTGRDRRIPQANVDAVERFMAEDGLFTIATGRSRPMFDHSSRDIRVNAPHILSNGSAVYDYATRSWIFWEDLPEDADAVMADLVARFPDVFGEVQTKDEHYGFNGDPAHDDWMQRIGVLIRRLPLAEIPRPWLKLRFLIQQNERKPGPAPIVREMPEELVRRIDAMKTHVESAYGDRYRVERPSALSIEVMRAGTHKGLTARRLALALGRKTLVCVGDALNDLSMLQEADVAFVTGDAEPAMYGYGFRVAAPCGEGAVASVIDALGAARP